MTTALSFGMQWYPKSVHNLGWMKQTFTAAYHPASNGFVEKANGKILEVLSPIVNELLDN